MSHAPRVWIALHKEIRALLPLWVACTIALGAVAALRDPMTRAAGVVTFALCAIALGAQSVGHEYGHRTLGLLLSQPADRRRLYLSKLGVLAAMLLTLSLVAWIVLFPAAGPVRASIWHQPRVLLLAALCGFFIAPWMTMVCRGVLPGFVFTIALPLLLLAAGDLIATVRYGTGGGAPIDRFKLAVLWQGAFVLCAVAGVFGWRMFMNLEAIDHRGRELHMPRWRSGPATRVETVTMRRRHPLWQLAKKELHLQHMTFVVVGLYVVCWGVMATLQRLAPDLRDLPAGPLTFLYFGMLSILIGALASAEERQFGTLEWQALLPMAAWRQWAIKAGMAVTLAVVLAVGVPAALQALDRGAPGFHLPPRALAVIAVQVALLATASLYVSSLCASGVRAMVLTLPTVLGALVFVRVLVGGGVEWGLRALATAGVSPPVLWGDSGAVVVMRVLTVALPAGLAALLLRLGFVNHRSAERGVRRVCAQAAAIAGFLALSVVLLEGQRLFSG